MAYLSRARAAIFSSGGSFNGSSAFQACCNAAFTSSAGHVQVGQKFGVRAVLPVIGLLRWHRQQFADEREVEVQQECSVKKQEVFAAALGVAGKFAFADGEIGVAADRPRCGLRIDGVADVSIAARFWRMMNWLATPMLWSGPSAVIRRTSV